MATRTNPLVSAAVLASAAAVAVATPAIAPSVHLPSPHALAAAKVQLATFSDLLSISATDWSNVLFGGYGEAISPNQDPDFDWAAAYVSPFTGCDFNCKVNGPSGIAYLALDSLINGNGTGYAPVLKDPTKPYNETTNPYVGGYPTWNVGAVNYFFEGGPGPGVEYLVVQPFGDPKSPLYNPTVAGIITQAFQGAANVTTFYVAGLTALASLALQVPTIGPYVYGAINAYLGPNTSDPYFGNWGYYAGLSGILRYVSDVITTGGNPFPPYGPTQPAASTTTLAAAAATLPAAAASVAEAPKIEAAPAARTAKDSTPAVSEVKVSAPADTKADSTPAVSEVKVSAPVVSEPKVDSPAVSVPASTPAPEVKPVEAPSVPDVKPSAPAVDSTPAPVKDLGKEIAKSEASTSSSSSSSSSSTGADSDSKSGASDSKPATTDVKVSAPEATSSAATSAASETKAGATDAGGSDAGSSSASSESAK